MQRPRLPSCLHCFLETSCSCRVFCNLSRRCSGRLHVSLSTAALPPRNVIVNCFESKRDLIEVLLASCYIPLYYEKVCPHASRDSSTRQSPRHPLPTTLCYCLNPVNLYLLLRRPLQTNPLAQPAQWSRRLWLDGGVTCNVPQLPGYTTHTVSPRSNSGCSIRPSAAGVIRDYGLFSLMPSGADDCEVVQQVARALTGCNVACARGLPRSLTPAQDGFVDAVEFFSTRLLRSTHGPAGESRWR